MIYNNVEYPNMRCIVDKALELHKANKKEELVDFVKSYHANNLEFSYSNMGYFAGYYDSTIQILLEKIFDTDRSKIKWGTLNIENKTGEKLPDKIHIDNLLNENYIKNKKLIIEYHQIEKNKEYLQREYVRLEQLRKEIDFDSAQIKDGIDRYLEEFIPIFEETHDVYFTNNDTDEIRLACDKIRAITKDINHSLVRLLKILQEKESIHEHIEKAVLLILSESLKIKLLDLSKRELIGRLPQFDGKTEMDYNKLSFDTFFVYFVLKVKFEHSFINRHNCFGDIQKFVESKE